MPHCFSLISKECRRRQQATVARYRIATLPFVFTLITCMPTPGHAQKAEAQSLYEQGLSLMQAGRLADAQRVLLKAQTQAPSNTTIKVSLGKVDSLLGKNADAVNLFREVEARQPMNSANELNLAIALAAEGSLNEALPHATQAVQAAPRSAAAHHTRGKILDGLSREEEAETEFEVSLHIAPRDPLTLFDYALLCETSGHLVKEVELLRKLLVLEPGQAQLHELLGRALSRTGNQSESRAEFREAIRLNPKDRVALYGLSRALLKEDPAESARLAARFQALRLSEDETNTLQNRGNEGVAAMQAHDWPRAIALFQSALATCAGCSLAVTLEKDLGLAQCQNGDTQAGAASLRRSLAINPNDLDTLKGLELAESSNAQKN